MDQRVIATFKAHYICQTFMEMLIVLDRLDTTIKDYWCSFYILKGTNNINTVWDEVTVKCLNGVWHKLLPEFMHDFTGFGPVENSADIHRLMQTAGMDEVTAEDATELLESQGQ
jgi:hypothetical protein